MSTIIFEGNTYTFGATVSANPGTGTTSYVFGGLNDGQTYGFIIWAFNGFGTSSIVGPTIVQTLSQFEESREAINLFSWEFPYRPISSSVGYISGSTVNLFYSTEDLGNTKFWSYGNTMIPYQTDPFGGTSAYKWVSVSSGGSTIVSTRDTTPVAPVIIEPNQEYILSFWMDLSRGITFLPAYGTPSPSILYFGSGSGPVLTQLLPYTGTAGQPTQFAPAASGWVRYAWSFTPISSPLTVRILNGSAGAGTFREMYLYGPQLEKA